MAGGEKTLTIGLSQDLHRELKMASVVSDCTMKEIMLRAIRRELQNIRSDMRGAKSENKS